VLDRAGLNLGWPILEGVERLRRGTADPPDYAPPVLVHGRSTFCSIVGGYVARRGELRGRYVYGDVCSGRIYAATMRGSRWRSRRLPIRVPYLVSFGRDAAGRLYAVSLRGPVWRLTS
jgi:hypothetical protein